MGLSEIKNRQWAIFKTIAKTGKGLDDAFKWLTGILKDDNKIWIFDILFISFLFYDYNC